MPPNKEVVDGFTYEFLPRRGINKHTLEFYDVKTKIDKDGKPISVGYPYRNGAYKVRILEPKGFYSKGNIAQSGLFGREKFPAGCHKYVTITEGEDDALSLYQVIHTPTVSVQSAGTAHRDCVRDLDWLKSFERIYLALDSDAPGREAMRTIARLFDYERVFIVKFDGRKDANEYLQHGEDDTLRAVHTGAKRYLPEQIISSLDEFKRLLEEPPKLGIPYPWPTLTAMTYGMRTGESVLITAQEGVGKTEFMHAIEYNLLTETKDNVGAIYLEEPGKRHLEALTSIHLRSPVHLPDTTRTTAEKVRALEELVGMDDRLHLYVHFGSLDPETLLDTIRFLVSARSCRWILLDHISMVLSGAEGIYDERRGLDYLVTKLEMMIKELDFGLVSVSHVNDFGQTRGSRYIAKIFETRIDLDRDLKNPDPRVSNTTNLMLSKNRWAMKTGPAGQVVFDPDTYTLTEVEHVPEAQVFSSISPITPQHDLGVRDGKTVQVGWRTGSSSTKS